MKDEAKRMQATKKGNCINSNSRTFLFYENHSVSYSSTDLCTSFESIFGISQYTSELLKRNTFIIIRETQLLVE